MDYIIVYEPDFSRIYPAILIDSRADIPAIKNQVGSAIKAYTDSQVALITPTSIFYKIETGQGVIAGVFSVNVDTTIKTGTLGVNQLRPAFEQFSVEIQKNINNFITSKTWQQDYLF